MLEDSKMDKKTTNRSSQPQSRAPAIDCKKNSEVTQRPWPRSNKKREGPGNSSKNEPFRKNVPAQRGRGMVDRRPRPRGSGGYAVGGMEITGIADDETEFGSVFVPGSKKQNLNHLLNFMYTPRGAQEHIGPAPRRNNPHRAFVPHNNELFLQACCQFVVKEEGDYKGNLLDPDLPVKWELIEEIVVRSTGRSECPVCLGSPAAGRVGRCGHVLCWPCALHYCEVHERSPPPCPVCAAPFRVELMKPARMLQWEQPSEEVSMRLVRRARGSTAVEAAPARGLQAAAAEIPPLDTIGDAPYSKLFFATKQQVHEILLRERKELEEQILAEIDTTEIVYMERALQMLKMQEESLKQETVAPKIEIEKDVVPTVYQKQEENLNKIDWFDVNEDEEGAQCIEKVDKVEEQLADLAIGFDESPLNPEAPEFELNNNTTEEFPLVECLPLENEEVAINDIDKENQSKYFYFYQAEDGQQVFLNSLNVRILNASWGALAAAPLIIKGRVLHRETFSLTEQTRKHMPFTAHLPQHCPFDVVELDLRPPFVSAPALQSYSEELDRRMRMRARSEREERRRERAYRRSVEGPPRPDFTSPSLFPPPEPPSPPRHAPPTPIVDSPPVDTPSTSGSGLSFAKMASGGGSWRARATPPAPPAPRPASPPPLLGSAPRTLCLSDAIEAARLAAPTQQTKKKKKQKVLFSMGMQHSEYK